jgi:hypothetical protein
VVLSLISISSDLQKISNMGNKDIEKLVPPTNSRKEVYYSTEIKANNTLSSSSTNSKR